MKNCTLIIFLIILSFNANASMSLKTLYGYCKPYQASGFKKFDRNSIACTSYLRGLVDQGYENCKEFRESFNRKNPIAEIAPEMQPQVNLLIRLASLTANKFVKDIKIIINSFIKFAEANMHIWEYNSVAFHRGDIVGKINRCDLKK